MPPDRPVYYFGDFTLDVPNRLLTREGATVALGGRAFDVLAVLARRAGELVTKNDLLDEVWPDLAVEENNIQVQVSALRRALGPSWIVTVPGRGYRFAAETHASPESAPRRDTAPRPATELIGRRDDVQAVVDHLERGGVVTLAGPGGIGKTRIAQEIAHLWPAGGCAWIDLAALPDAALVTEGVAAVLGVSLAGGEEPFEAIAATLRGSDRLLVFDNGEHVLGALAPLIARLVAAGAARRVLITSRAPCRIAGEHVHRLAPLAVPDADASVAVAGASDAVALFVARARAQVGDFQLDARSVSAVVRMCRRLDGVPLALELAAGRLAALGLTELVERLEQRFRVLTAGDRAAPDRQRTLEALFDWSHDLLDASARRTFRRLALLAPPFTLAQAVAVCADAEQDDWAVVDTLGDLVDCSLVFADAGEPPCYSLLESGRAYARARVDPLEDGEAIERAIAMYCEFGAAAAARSANAEALHACSAALDIVALLAPGDTRDRTELDICLALGPAIQASIGPAHPRAEAVYRRAVELAGTADGARRFAALWGLWHFLDMSGRDDHAAPEADTLVRVAAELGDEALELEAWHARMTTCLLRGRPRDVVAEAARISHRYERARHHALTHRFGGHDPGVCAWGQGAVGHALMGDSASAADFAGRAVELGVALDHAYSLGAGLFYAAITWQMLGDTARSLEVSGTLAALCDNHAMNMLRTEARLLHGRARWDGGDDGGLDDMAAALDAIDASGDFAFALYYTTLLVEALLARARPDDALRWLDRARLYADGGQRFFAPEIARLHGEACARAGAHDAAMQHFSDADAGASDAGALVLAVRAAASAVRWATSAGATRARSRLHALVDALPAGAESPDVANARALLGGAGRRPTSPPGTPARPRRES